MNQIKENYASSNDASMVAVATTHSGTFDYAAASLMNLIDIEKNHIKEIRFLGNEKQGNFLFILSEKICIKDKKGNGLKFISENSLANYQNWNVMQAIVDHSESVIKTSSIITGKDTRTTCMIRNIPNKYNQQMLLDVINESHFGNFDFLYLRIDFKNKCNVGYAFINFIHPKYILTFYEKFYGKKWTRFNSDKICSLSYAKIQGKKTLIQKFRTSAVMLEDPSFRPKLFHTDGILAGLEEEFPVDLMLGGSDSECPHMCQCCHNHDKRAEQSGPPTKPAKNSQPANAKDAGRAEGRKCEAPGPESPTTLAPLSGRANLSPEKRTISRPSPTHSRKAFTL